MDIEALVKVILSDEEMRQKIEELTKGLTVYISESGNTYHKYPDCHYLQVRGQIREPKAVSLLCVKECMYKACTACLPPR